jgi:hypothetical protein
MELNEVLFHFDWEYFSFGQIDIKILESVWFLGTNF